MNDEINLLRRKLAEVEECAQQAMSIASAANLRVTELREALERLTDRIDRLRVEVKAIAEITG